MGSRIGGCGKLEAGEWETDDSSHECKPLIWVFLYLPLHIRHASSPGVKTQEGEEHMAKCKQSICLIQLVKCQWNYT